MDAKYPKPNKVLQPCSVSDQEVFDYFPVDSRCTVDHSNETKLYNPPCYMTHLHTQKKTLQVKKVLPAVMLVSPFSSYADEHEWGCTQELLLVDWNSVKKKFLVQGISGGKKDTYIFEMDLHDDQDGYCLTATGSRWKKILKYATVQSKFKPGKFLYTKKLVENLSKKQATDQPKVWVQFGEQFGSEIEWTSPCRTTIKWKDQPDEKNSTGIWFNDWPYAFYDRKTGFYHRYEESEHIVRLVSRVKLVESRKN